MAPTPHPITLQELTDQLEMAHSVRQTLCADIAKLTEELVEAKLHSAQACLGSALGLPNPNPSPSPSPNLALALALALTLSLTLTLTGALPYRYP